MKDTTNSPFDDDNMSTCLSGSEEANETQPLAHRETIAVKRSKALVILTLVLAAAAVAIPTYMLSAKEEKEDFEGDIDTFADEIGEVAEAHTRSILGALRGLSTAFTAHAVSANQAWPNVTLPFFEPRTMEARKVSGSRVLLFAPIVTDKNGWEAYAMEHQDWIPQGLEFQGVEDHQEISIPPQIFPVSVFEAHDDDNNNDDDNLYAPIWQTGVAPTNPANINMDLMSHPTLSRLMKHVMATREPAVSEIVDLSFLYKYSTAELGKEEGDDEVQKDDEEESEAAGNEPHTCIIQPVFADFRGDSAIVGFMMSVFPWSQIFMNDELIRGMYAVLDDSCGGTSHTYFINEKTVEYRGPSDSHEKKFNYLGTEKEFELSEEEEDEDEDRFRRVLDGDDEDDADGEDDASIVERL